MAATSDGVKTSFGAHLAGGIDGLSKIQELVPSGMLIHLKCDDAGWRSNCVRSALAITTYQRAGADGIETSRRRTFASWTGPSNKDQDVSE